MEMGGQLGAQAALSLVKYSLVAIREEVWLSPELGSGQRRVWNPGL
jgi:hypothetical protein